ncbi:GNAT family N-acetyltransferase [Clostridium sp. C2-6-12]|uniref:GNAT family N-acetyltransferase n=1 Tax=Clostridium sp. C2-6-12 TaxID=2698832 RepID=UPI00136ECF5C|nr:GNAT family N-acetyltransferase [Clostridium sp. C2-6-12]
MHSDNKQLEQVRFIKATDKDVPVILAFIKQIATYEKMLDKVIATEESLKESIFENNRAEALLIELDKKVIGYIVYFFNYSTFVGREGLYIEDIYIKPEYRGQGLGKICFEFLVRIAKKHKCQRVEWTCLDWNEPSLKFYKNIGAKQMNEWIIHRLDKEEIDRISEEGL